MCLYLWNSNFVLIHLCYYYCFVHQAWVPRNPPGNNPMPGLVCGWLCWELKILRKCHQPLFMYSLDSSLNKELTSSSKSKNCHAQIYSWFAYFFFSVALKNVFVPFKSFGLSTWWPLLTWKVKRSDIKCYTWCPYISRVTLAKGSKQEGKVFLEQETLFASRISKRAVLGIGFARNREIYHLAKKSLSLLILILQCCLFRTFGNQEDLWIS